jgi:hypothetical protein
MCLRAYVATSPSCCSWEALLHSSHTCDLSPGSFESSASISHMSPSASCSTAVNSRIGAGSRLVQTHPSSAVLIWMPYTTGDSASATALASNEGEACLAGRGRICSDMLAVMLLVM